MRGRTAGLVAVLSAFFLLGSSSAIAQRGSGIGEMLGSLAGSIPVGEWVSGLREAADQEPLTVELEQLEVIKHGVSLREQPEQDAEEVQILGLGENLGFIQCIGEEWVAVVHRSPAARDEDGLRWRYVKAEYLKDMDGDPPECQANWLGSERLDMVRLHIGSF
ncbi:hypothetical protein LRD18_01990 [Halorhodospira halochloris]|uniref:hypothetical protein n=1 Tax=Halorhodospira halochloris TaxID=1052 RepID=UPI001EE8F491|nr:hypothetical protein [Halorhodospira halochloris]MCG5529644.1 hypothetical protein [Halorhodospira halochloris]